MKVKVRSENKRTNLYLFGDIDIQGSEALFKQLDKILKDDSIVEVLLDFEKVKSIFSRGVK